MTTTTRRGGDGGAGSPSKQVMVELPGMVQNGPTIAEHTIPATQLRQRRQLIDTTVRANQNGSIDK